MAYKSPRLLIEAVNKEMETLRKFCMSSPQVEVGDETSIDSLNELRTLVGELGAMAMRPTLDEIASLPPVEYVATMKPLVGQFHRQLMVAERLSACLNEDLEADACILMLIGDGKTIVQAAHDPEKPGVALAVDTVITALDEGTKKISADAAALAAEAANDQAEKEPEPEGPLRVCYLDPIQEQDKDRNEKAVLVIDEDDFVVKDDGGWLSEPRKATQQEIDSCIVVKDPATGVGYEDEL